MSSGLSTVSTRFRPVWTSTSSSRGRATRRSRRSSRNAAPIPRTRATGRSASPTRTTRAASRSSSPATRPTVLYFGKLLYNKGVHVLLEAMRGIDARTLVVGFGDYRHELERIAPPRTLFTGPLEHRHLVQLIPLADVAVVPSIFPEAFGMVAAEAAAAGCPPLVARHSGLEEVAEGLEEGYPHGAAPPDELRDRRLDRPRGEDSRAARPPGGHACLAGRGGQARRGREVVVGGRRRASPRIGFSLQWVKRRSCPTAN